MCDLYINIINIDIKSISKCLSGSYYWNIIIIYFNLLEIYSQISKIMLEKGYFLVLSDHLCKDLSKIDSVFNFFNHFGNSISESNPIVNWF